MTHKIVSEWQSGLHFVADTLGGKVQILPTRIMVLEGPEAEPAQKSPRTLSNLFGLFGGKRISDSEAFPTLRKIDDLIFVDAFEEMLRRRADTPADTRPTPITDPSRLEQANRELMALVNLAKEVHIEDGMDNELYVAFQAFLAKYENVGLAIMSEEMFGSRTPEHTLSTLLEYVGKSEETNSTTMRRQLIESYLTHESPVVRDGAIVGLSYLEDPAAIPALQTASDKETRSDLRRDIKEIIEELVAFSS